MSVHHGKLHHKTPGWVPSAARFHIRIRLDGAQRPLTDAQVAPELLDSAAFYHEHQRWYAWLFLLMPDHLHAVLSFPIDAAMSGVIGDWKRYQAGRHGIVWQEGYFDHRLRNEDQAAEKYHYIRMNPVRQDLCRAPEEWPWVVEPWKASLAQASSVVARDLRARA
jgi:REP element-mobilizing transposase RayT